MPLILCKQVRRNNFYCAVQLLVLLPPAGRWWVGVTRFAMFRVSGLEPGLMDRQACFEAVQAATNSFAT
jgi:hypothetical protein